MKDKFEIFQNIIAKETSSNHSHIYITISQMWDIMIQVNSVYGDWDEELTLDENVQKHFSRSIRPMGSCGSNRIGGMFNTI